MIKKDKYLNLIDKIFSFLILYIYPPLVLALFVGMGFIIFDALSNCHELMIVPGQSCATNQFIDKKDGYFICKCKK